MDVKVPIGIENFAEMREAGRDETGTVTSVQYNNNIFVTNPTTACRF